MQHLALKINNKYVVVPEDFSVDFEDVNPLFNDYESFAAEIDLPIESNRELFSDMDTIQSDKRMLSIDNLPMQIIVDGVPYRSGKSQTAESETIEDTINFQMIQSTLTLEDMIAQMTCQDVPVKDKIKIGEMVGNLKVEVSYNVQLNVHGTVLGDKNKDKFTEVIDVTNPGRDDGKFVDELDLELPALGFSKTIDTGTGESLSNVTLDYTAAKFCNARVCYRHYEKNEDGTSSNVLSQKGVYDPYFVLEADRPQSGVCFYVLYFLDCLFHYLGFNYDNSKLTTIGDMNKLCFFTTHCKYDLEKHPYNGTKFKSIEDINKWLTDNKTNGKLEFANGDEVHIESVTGNYGGQDVTAVVGESGSFVIDGVNWHVAEFYDIWYTHSNETKSITADWMDMYANSKNFPSTSVKSILDSLWAGWGIRFDVDYEQNTVTPYFIREVFRDTSAPIEMEVQLISIHKINEKISGVRMCYSEESDSSEQKKNVSEGVRDYNTDFDYVDYTKYSTGKTYLDVLQNRSATDMTCYITPNTGNAYRIKVNGDAKTAGEMRPTAFEVGGYKGVEIGDCSDKNKDYIEELTIDMVPVILTDVNGKNERNAGTSASMSSSSTSGSAELKGNLADRKQVLAAFVDEDMWHENIPIKIQNAMGNSYRNYTLDCVLTTDECFDPANSDDGNSPLQHYDWGAAICMMRGGGADMQIQKYDYNYDGCGNYKWRTTAGDYTMNPDSIDNWGNDYDYNGTSEGIGNDERFSLKIQAYKEVDGQILCNADEVDKDGKVTRKVRSRGLKDTFMSEYIHWLMNRKLVEIQFRCEASQLAGIQWTKRYRIGEYVFFWNKLNYTATAKDGLGVVTAQVYI